MRHKALAMAKTYLEYIVEVGPEGLVFRMYLQFGLLDLY